MSLKIPISKFLGTEIFKVHDNIYPYMIAENFGQCDRNDNSRNKSYFAAPIIRSHISKIF